MAFGGGVEKNVTRHFAFRGGADYLFDRFSFPLYVPPFGISINQNSFRLNAGMVYVFGPR
jgi:hypothetical protein